MEDIITGNEALSVVNMQKGLNFFPHTKFQYSNTNYLLLGEIVKTVTGQSLADYAKAHIFKPLQNAKNDFQ